MLVTNNAQVQAESDTGMDIYHIYDRSHKFHVADITLKAELVKNDNKFTLFQSVKFNVIKHSLLDYNIKSLHFDTQRVNGLWATANGTYAGWIIVGGSIDESVDIFDQQEIKVNQTFNPDENWNNINFNVKAQFINLYLETDKGSIDIPFDVYFTFSENGSDLENAIDDQIIDELEINVWEFLKNELQFLYIAINFILFLYLILYLYLFFQSKDLFTMSVLKTSFSRKHSSEHSEYKAYKLNEGIKQVTISLTIIYILIKLFISINTLSGTRFSTFDIILFFFLYFVIPYCFNFFQNIRITPLLHDCYCSNTRWSKNEDMLNSINTKYKINIFNVSSLFLFLLAPLFNTILENIIVIL